MKSFNYLRKIHPALTLLLSFLAAIIGSSIMLMLPLSTANGKISFIDAIFTSTSAVCVTGLTVLDTGSYFSRFGQSVILILIQTGGLGIMTLSVFFFRKVRKSNSLHQRQIIQDLYTHTPIQDIWVLLKTILIFTITTEGIGFIILFWAMRIRGIESAAFSALFHTISSFCNAGFSLYSNSLESFKNSFFINATVALLIIMGGIGFPVIHDVLTRIINKQKESNRLSVHTKIVLLTTSVLIILGTIAIFILEFNNTMQNFSIKERILISFFQSVTARTAGFNSINISRMNASTLFIISLLMFIGASPGSCGGGIKTTTVAVVVAHLKSRICRKEQTTLLKRGISSETIGKSMSLILLASTLIGVMTFFLLLAEPCSEIKQYSIFTILFEAISAFGTVGLSMGITSSLSSVGKIVLIILMITGRVGILSIIYIIIGNGAKDERIYSEENVMIG